MPRAASRSIVRRETRNKRAASLTVISSEEAGPGPPSLTDIFIPTTPSLIPPHRPPRAVMKLCRHATRPALSPHADNRGPGVSPEHEEFRPLRVAGPLRDVDDA